MDIDLSTNNEDREKGMGSLPSGLVTWVTGRGRVSQYLPYLSELVFEVGKIFWICVDHGYLPLSAVLKMELPRESRRRFCPEVRRRSENERQLEPSSKLKRSIFHFKLDIMKLNL